MAVTKTLKIKQLLKKNYANSKVLQNLAYGAAKKKAEGLQNTALKELNEHQVTKELERGSSGTSILLGGRGNFFGFLGFEKGYQPVSILKDILEKGIKIRNTKGKLKKVSETSFLWEFDIDIPSTTDIYRLTQTLDWTTRSWVSGIEKGITNAAQTVFRDSERSRSGVALQTTRNVGFITFHRTPYITDILNNLRKQLA